MERVCFLCLIVTSRLVLIKPLKNNNLLKNIGVFVMQKYLIFLSFLSSMCSYAMREDAVLVGLDDGEEISEELYNEEVPIKHPPVQLRVVKPRYTDLSNTCLYATSENSMLVGTVDGEEDDGEEIVYKNGNENAERDETIQLCVVKSRHTDTVTISDGGYQDQIARSGGRYFYDKALSQGKERYLDAFFEVVKQRTNCIRDTEDGFEGKCVFDRNSWLFILDKVNGKK